VRKGSFSLNSSRQKHYETEKDSGELGDFHGPILAGSVAKQDLLLILKWMLVNRGAETVNSCSPTI